MVIGLPEGKMLDQRQIAEKHEQIIVLTILCNEKRVQETELCDVHVYVVEYERLVRQDKFHSLFYAQNFTLQKIKSN